MCRRTCARRSQRGRGLIAARRRRSRGGAWHLTAAIAALSGLGYPYWLARVRTDLGALLVHEGRAEEARVVLDDAIAALLGLGATPALARAEAVAG